MWITSAMSRCKLNVLHCTLGTLLSMGAFFQCISSFHLALLMSDVPNACPLWLHIRRFMEDLVTMGLPRQSLRHAVGFGQFFGSDPFHGGRQRGAGGGGGGFSPPCPIHDAVHFSGVGGSTTVIRHGSHCPLSEVIVADQFRISPCSTLLPVPFAPPLKQRFKKTLWAPLWGHHLWGFCAHWRGVYRLAALCRRNGPFAPRTQRNLKLRKLSSIQHPPWKTCLTPPPKHNTLLFVHLRPRLSSTNNVLQQPLTSQLPTQVFPDPSPWPRTKLPPIQTATASPGGLGAREHLTMLIP